MTTHDYAQLSTMVDFMVLSIKLVFTVLGVSYSRVLAQRPTGCCSASIYIKLDVQCFVKRIISIVLMLQCRYTALVCYNTRFNIYHESCIISIVVMLHPRLSTISPSNVVYTHCDTDTQTLTQFVLHIAERNLLTMFGR